jgi:homospermidine synthase
MQSIWACKGIHIAERDTQARRLPRPRGTFVNTWSVEGFISEGLPARRIGLGHPSSRGSPRTDIGHETGCRAGDLARPARRDHPGAYLVPDPGAAVRLPGDA